MRFMAWNVLFSCWLILSTFAFEQGAASFLLCWITALAVSAVAALSPARPGIRFIITFLAFALFWCAILLPEVSGLAMVNNAIVAGVLFLLSLVRPASSKKEEKPTEAPA
jgi:uncharacterized membrane protein